MHARRSDLRFGRSLIALPLGFLLLFYLWPLFGILRLSLFPQAGSDVGATLAHSLRPAMLRVIGFTTFQALASTLLTLTIGLPLAWAFARLSFPGKHLMRSLATLPFVMPTIVVAAGFTALLGPGGALNALLSSVFGTGAPTLDLLQSVTAIVLAHAFYNVGVVIRTVGGFWENLGPQVEEAASMLGAGPVQRWYRVTLPLLMPAVLSASLLIFLFCFTSFGVILILGGPSFATIEVEIYRQATGLLNLPVAATLSLVQMGFALFVLRAYSRVQDRVSLPLSLRSRGAMPPIPSRTGHQRWLGFGMTLLLLLLLSPLLALLWRSVALGGDLSLQHYRNLFAPEFAAALVRSPWIAARNSLWIAALTTSLSLVLGLAAALVLARRSTTAPHAFRRRPFDATVAPSDPLAASAHMRAPELRSRSSWLDPLLMLPLGTSAVTLGLGYIIVFGPWLSSPFIVPAAHALIATPFVLRILLPALRRLDPRLREAAATLGANPAQVGRRIDFPLILPALIVAAVFAFMVSLGEFGASLLLSRPQQPTIPIMIYRVLRPGLASYGLSLALSVVLMLLTVLGMLLIERFRTGEGESF